MIIKQKVMRNVSLTAHPQGCARYMEDHIAWTRAYAMHADTSRYPKRVLVIGGSTGYGLASRTVAAFAGKADTINISLEREPLENKTATPGWYNTMVFEREAQKEGLFAESIFGDAFSVAVKEQTAARIAETVGQVDLVVYSLASPIRIDPVTGQTYRSVIKPIGRPFSALSVDVSTGIIETATVEPADDTQIYETVKVMGGEDWRLWIDLLKERSLLAPAAKTVAYSYIGPPVTYPIYREGTIGKAKEDLENTARDLCARLASINGEAYVSINKALVTRASAVIPVVPLYIALLYKVMKEKGIHEQCIQQMARLFSDRLYGPMQVPVDEQARIHLDDREMQPDVQAEVNRRWGLQKPGEPIVEGDLDGFKEEYDHIHGFGYPSIDYSADVDPRYI